MRGRGEAEERGVEHKAKAQIQALPLSHTVCWLQGVPRAAACLSCLHLLCTMCTWSSILLLYALLMLDKSQLQPRSTALVAVAVVAGAAANVVAVASVASVVAHL